MVDNSIFYSTHSCVISINTVQALFIADITWLGIDVDNGVRKAGRRVDPRARPRFSVVERDRPIQSVAETDLSTVIETRIELCVFWSVRRQPCLWNPSRLPVVLVFELIHLTVFGLQFRGNYTGIWNWTEFSVIVYCADFRIYSKVCNAFIALGFERADSVAHAFTVRTNNDWQCSIRSSFVWSNPSPASNLNVTVLVERFSWARIQVNIAEGGSKMCVTPE